MDLPNLLNKLYQEKKAIFAYNVITFDAAYVIAEFSSKNKIPCLVQTSSKVAEYYGPEYWGNVIKIFSRDFPRRIFLHLDHCSSLELIRDSLKSGYDSIMVDGSFLPLDKNIELTQKVVKLARSRGCLVEGEVGHLEELNPNKAGLTQLEEAKRFVKETQVDLFAPTFGNVHGHYKNLKKRLDFGLLKEIAQEIKVPLVLHGGSGLEKSEIKKCVRQGVVKINISTDLKDAFARTFNKFKKKILNQFEFNNNLYFEYKKILKKHSLILI